MPANWSENAMSGGTSGGASGGTSAAGNAAGTAGAAASQHGTAMVDERAFRQGMALLAGAVNVITTAGDDEPPAGFTATAVCSVSAEPPILLVCLNAASSVAPVFERATTLCVNTLGAAQDDVARLFGGKTPMDERFAAGKWHQGITGAPVLAGALVAFETRIVQRQPMGTHLVMFCQVNAVHPGNPACGASLYWNRAFRSLMNDTPAPA